MTKPHYSGTNGRKVVARISQVAQPSRARLYSLLHALGTLETHVLTELDAEPLEVRPEETPHVWRQVGPDIPSGTGPLVDRNGDPV